VHVLFVTQYFTPEIGATSERIHAFARACVARGHRVTVVTEFPSHPHGTVAPEYRGRLWAREALDGFSVVRVWVRARPVKTPAARLAQYGSFCALAAVAGLFVRPRVDVVVASSPPLPVGPAGWAVARLRRARFVFDVRDLWPAAVSALGLLSSPTLLRLAEALERFLYRRADHVTTVTQGFVRHIGDRGAPPAQITWLPNGAPEDLDALPDDRGLRDRLGLTGRFVVTYAGNHGLAQALPVVLEAAHLLRDQPEIAFLFLGDGPLKQDLVRRAEALGLASVRFLPPVPSSAVPPYLAASDALLVPLRGHSLFDTFIPSKLFASLACGRPVLLMANGEARTVLDASGGGVWVPPEDPGALAKAVGWLAEQPAAARREMGERGRGYVATHYRRAAHAERMAALLEGLGGRP
jgi:glycosyltransferase involved in cell wall biosynthesis